MDKAALFYERMCNEGAPFTEISKQLGQFSAVLFYLRKFEKEIRAEAIAEVLREAADRLRMTFFRDTGLYGYDGAKSNVDALNECETLCAAITQEPKP
jgi:hypothetical protein